MGFEPGPPDWETQALSVKPDGLLCKLHVIFMLLSSLIHVRHIAVYASPDGSPQNII